MCWCVDVLMNCVGVDDYVDDCVDGLLIMLMCSWCVDGVDVLIVLVCWGVDDCVDDMLFCLVSSWFARLWVWKVSVLFALVDFLGLFWFVVRGKHLHPFSSRVVSWFESGARGCCAHTFPFAVSEWKRWAREKNGVCLFWAVREGVRPWTASSPPNIQSLVKSVHMCRYWPFPDVPECNLPQVITNSCEQFRSYYTNFYNGRRLKWNTSLVRRVCLKDAHSLPRPRNAVTVVTSLSCGVGTHLKLVHHWVRHRVLPLPKFTFFFSLFFSSFSPDLSQDFSKVYRIVKGPVSSKKVKTCGQICKTSCFFCNRGWNFELNSDFFFQICVDLTF
jgi:hypothetical protein